MKNFALLALAAVLSFANVSFAEEENTKDSQPRKHGHRHVDPMAAPAVNNDNLEIPEKGEKKVSFQNKDESTSTSENRSSVQSEMDRRASKWRTEKSTQASQKSARKAKKAAAMPAKAKPEFTDSIILGVPRMQSSVYDLPPVYVKKSPAQMSLQFTSFQPSHFTPASSLNGTSNFQAKNSAEIALDVQQNLDLEKAPLLASDFSTSYLRSQRTGSTALNGGNLNMSEDLNLLTIKIGLVNEFLISGWGTKLRPFIGAAIDFSWAQAATGAFDNGINQTIFGHAEKVGLNYRDGAWLVSAGFENRMGLTSSQLNGTDLFAGIGRNLE